MFRGSGRKAKRAHNFSTESLSENHKKELLKKTRYGGNHPLGHKDAAASLNKNLIHFYKVS